MPDRQADQSSVANSADQRGQFWLLGGLGESDQTLKEVAVETATTAATGFRAH